ncbi:MAG: hypothetical protein U1C48_00655 [Methylotenera sp.]|nr:hypothetical protein [Methylotenera sp.]
MSALQIICAENNFFALLEARKNPREKNTSLRAALIKPSRASTMKPLKSRIFLSKIAAWQVACFESVTPVSSAIIICKIN